MTPARTGWVTKWPDFWLTVYGGKGDRSGFLASRRRGPGAPTDEAGPRADAPTLDRGILRLRPVAHQRRPLPDVRLPEHPARRGAVPGRPGSSPLRQRQQPASLERPAPLRRPHPHAPGSAAGRPTLCGRIPGPDDPDRYVMRAIVADCLRAAEYLFFLDRVDPARIAVRGTDLAVLIAARRPRFRALVVEAPYLHRIDEARQATDAYPLEELNDYARCHADGEAALARTLALFDPTAHAPDVTATTVVGIGDGHHDNREWLAPLLEAFPTPPEERVLTFRGGVDADWFDAWLAGRLGAAPMPRFSAVPR